MSDEEINDPLVGIVIDEKYRIENLLGEGGMGKVFTVTHLSLNKSFALKLMHVQAGNDPQNVIRFRREAEALARITHPNVVMVIDFGFFNEQPYIVMEYIDGISFRQMLKRTAKLSERQTIHIVKQICAGLNEAHRKGVVHRDLKPENIMIQEFADGEVMARVLDFGIAKMMKKTSDKYAGVSGGSNDSDSIETDTPGTIKYMSPEQIFSEPIDARSDIFTICLMIYEALTGNVPSAILGKITPLYEVRDDVSYQINDIVLRGLSRNREERPRTALELKRELENVEQETMFQAMEMGEGKKGHTGALHEPAGFAGHAGHREMMLDTHPPTPAQQSYDTAYAHAAPSPAQSEEVPRSTAASRYAAQDLSDFTRTDDLEIGDPIISDFELFLTGRRAPLIVGQSLSMLIKNGYEYVAEAVFNWARNRTQVTIAEAIMSARSRVFDIFFYQIVKFNEIHNFFPLFEQSLLSITSGATNAQLAQLFQQYRWQDIRPIGNVREQQQQFVAEKRKEAKLQVEGFNEKIYKNATYAVLSTERRYVFNDDKQAEQVEEWQKQVRNVLGHFVELVDDKQLKKEILIANESDRYNTYESKETFKQDNYLGQLTEIAIALFNDQFLYQSVQLFNIILDLAKLWKVDLTQLDKFQEKGELINIQHIETYLVSEVDRFLVRQIFRLFNCWHPQYLLNQMQIEENRRTRRLLLKMLECFGEDIYDLLINELSTHATDMPWYYARNIVMLLGRVNSRDIVKKDQVVEILDGLWRKETQRQLIYQIISTWSFIGSAAACDRLIHRLRVAETQRDRRNADLCQKLILALIDTETERGLEAAIDYYQKEGRLEQLTERFNKIYISDRLVEMIGERIWKEVQRMKYSFSLLGDAETTVELLRLVSHIGSEAAQNLCQEIIKKLPRKHPLVAEAERTLAMLPAPIFSTDRTLQRLAIIKNVPAMICYIYEVGITGKLIVRTVDGYEAQIDFSEGALARSLVAAQSLEGDAAFHWTFQLDIAEIESIYCFPSHALSRNDSQYNQEYQNTQHTIIAALMRLGEILQISKNHLSLLSKYRQRPVNSFFTNFEQLTDEPKKYRAVWNALSQDSTITQLQRSTKLPKDEICRILVSFFKQKMLIIDGNREQQQGVYVEDGFMMLELNLRRIERRPVMFNYYKTAAEICADMIRETEDEVIRYAVDMKRRFYLEHFEYRKILTKSLALCRQTIELSLNYFHTHSLEDRKTIIEFVQEHLQVSDMPPPPEIEPGDPVLDAAPLEKIENIEEHNDPLDELQSTELATMAQDFATISKALGIDEKLAKVEEEETGSDLIDSKRALFDNIAMACVKPLKDFVREFYRNWKLGRKTTLNWIDTITPVLELLLISAVKVSGNDVAVSLMDLQNVLDVQREMALRTDQEVFSDEILQQIGGHYLQLCQLQPKTFSLMASDEELAEKRDSLIVRFVLKQIPGLEVKFIERLIFLGWNNFNRFMESKPTDLVKAGNISQEHAEQICMKFYQYRNIYYRDDDPDYERKFASMFEMNLRMLKEMNADIERLSISIAKDVNAKIKSDALKAERQRTLWALFIQLCINQEYDLVQLIQQSVFDMRIQLLEDYFGRLMAQIPDHQAA